MRERIGVSLTVVETAATRLWGSFEAWMVANCAIWLGLGLYIGTVVS